MKAPRAIPADLLLPGEDVIVRFACDEPVDGGLPDIQIDIFDKEKGYAGATIDAVEARHLLSFLRAAVGK